MAQIKTQALVLKSINWRETSKVTSLFTREIGRVDVIAKSSRILKSSFHGVLESLNHIECLISVIPSRSLQIISNATIIETFVNTRRDLDRITYAFGMIELIQFFFHEGESDPIFFDFLTTLLHQLNQAKNTQIIFWYFLIKLCSYLGFKPEFQNCFQCGKLINNSKVNFSISEGRPVCSTCINNYSNIIVIPKLDSQFLHKLQNTNHKKISQVVMKNIVQINIVQFLLDYLRFHTNENLNISAFTFFKKG